VLKRLTATGVLAFAVTGAVMAAAAPANADAHNVGGGNVLSGNQVIAPITVCGNAVNVLDVLASATAVCSDGKGHHSHH
jgi:hypothetical protein